MPRRSADASNLASIDASIDAAGGHHVPLDPSGAGQREPMLQCEPPPLVGPIHSNVCVISPAMPTPERRVQQLGIEPIIRRLPAVRTRRFEPAAVRRALQVMLELMDHAV